MTLSQFQAWTEIIENAGAVGIGFLMFIFLILIYVEVKKTNEKR